MNNNLKRDEAFSVLSERELEDYFQQNPMNRAALTNDLSLTASLKEQKQCGMILHCYYFVFCYFDISTLAR